MTIVDPFCGSGTVLLESMASGVPSVGVDSNPIATLVSSVKTSPLDPAELNSAGSALIRRARAKRPAALPAPFLKRWYSESALNALSKLASAARELDDSAISDALRVALALTARQVSITDKRIPVPVRPRVATGAPSNLAVWSAFELNLRKVAARTGRLKADWPRPLVITGDARNQETWKPIADITKALVITSPPYGAAQKYLRSTSLELAWLGMTGGRGPADLERKSVGREHLRRDERNPDISSLAPTLTPVLEKMRSIDPQRADIYSQYFLDMRRVFEVVGASLPTLKGFILVAGENRVLGELMPTHEYLHEMLQSMGFETKLALRDTIRGRSLLSTRNNSGTPASAEYVYWLER